MVKFKRDSLGRFIVPAKRIGKDYTPSMKFGSYHEALTVHAAGERVRRKHKVRAEARRLGIPMPRKNYYGSKVFKHF